MRVVLCICAYFLAGLCAVGQGTVDFDNHKVYFFTNILVDAPFFDDQGTRLEGPSYVAQLYLWRAGPGFRAVGSPVAFATDGYFSGGEVKLFYHYDRELFYVDEGYPAWVQVRAWRVDGGTTFEQAALTGAWTGLSGVLFLPRTGCPHCGGVPSGPVDLIGLQYPGSPLVVRQPQAQTILAGERATFTVIASSGVSMSYQWYGQPSDRPDGLIPGATNPAYTTPALRTNTTFWVSISNTAGSTLSERATMTVVPRAPQLRLSRIAGLPALTIDAVVGLTYRIEYNTNLSTSNWIVLAELSLTSNPFTFVDTQGTNSAIRFYRVLVVPP